MSESPKFQQNSESNQTTGVIFDSIEQFNADRRFLNLTIPFEKGMFYRIFFEVFVPHVCYEINIKVKSPTGLEYPILEYAEEIELDYQWNNVDYLAAETGDHNLTIEISVPSTQNLNILIRINETISILEYFAGNHLFLPNSTQLRFLLYDVIIFNPFHSQMIYTVELEDDTVYYFDFIRGNPIPVPYANQMNFQFPKVTMILTTNNSRYVLCDQIPTEPYMQSSPQITNVRYGSFCSGLGSIDIQIDQSAVNTNFAFLMYSNEIAGNGPDDQINNTLPSNTTSNSTDATNTTTEIPNGFNSTEIPDNITTFTIPEDPKQNSTVIGEFIEKFQQLVQDQPDDLLLIGGCLLGGGLVAGYINRRRRSIPNANRLRSEMVGM
jgi:hypothetical protein